VLGEGKERMFISISYFYGDVLTVGEKEMASFCEDYTGSSGQQVMKGIYIMCC
jgi:hypothetical protein